MHGCERLMFGLIIGIAKKPFTDVHICLVNNSCATGRTVDSFMTPSVLCHFSFTTAFPKDKGVLLPCYEDSILSLLFPFSSCSGNTPQLYLYQKKDTPLGHLLTTQKDSYYLVLIMTFVLANDG